MDNKHTVFGKIVGGLETLNEIEKIEVDNKDRPIEDIVIINTQIFVDPYQEADEQLAAERAEESQKVAEETAATEDKKKTETQQLKVYRPGVGKYLNIPKNER